MQASICENKNFLSSPHPQTILVWGQDHSHTLSCVDEEAYVRTYVRMALYRYFRPMDPLPGPSGPLSASVNPAAIKDTIRKTYARTRGPSIWGCGDACMCAHAKILNAKFYSKAISRFLLKFAPALASFPGLPVQNKPGGYTSIW